MRCFKGSTHHLLTVDFENFAPTPSIFGSRYRFAAGFPLLLRHIRCHSWRRHPVRRPFWLRSRAGRTYAHSPLELARPGQQRVISLAASRPFITGISKSSTRMSGALRCNFFHGFPSVASLFAYLPIILAFQQSAQTAPHDVAVIRDEDTDGRLGSHAI